jgi:hypothetical protein
MKIKINRLIPFTLVLVIFGACKKNMTDLNVNPKAPTNVQGEMLFTNGEKAFTDLITTPNVNFGNFELFAQYWAETTYPQESQYILNQRDNALNWWNGLYRDVIEDFNQAIILMNKQAADPTILAEDKTAYVNKIAIAKIFRAYAFSILVSTFGDIPYTEALQGRANTSPKYDNQKDVYYSLLDTIDASLALLDPSAASFGSSDLIYNGDVGKWVKLGNSIKLKLGMVLADVDPAKAKTEAEAAAANVFTSNADNALLPYTTSPPNVNPIWTNLVQSNRNDFVAANTIVDTMNTHNDPRRPYYFTDAAGSGNYIGGVYGSGNAFKNFSHPSDKIEAADFPGIIMDYAEVEFLLAEGAARGMNVGGTAGEHYNNGVAASIQWWSDGANNGAAYLALPVNQFDAANWKKSVGVQAWINYYTRGFDSWLSIRRLDYPKIVAPPSAVSAFPVRVTYPPTEENLNPNYKAAAAAIGGDEVTTKLFWDKF